MATRYRHVGAQTASISTKAGTIAPTQGYHSGAGSISISSTEQDKIIAGNIKDGITILGVNGTLAGVTEDDAEYPKIINRSCTSIVVPSSYTSIGIGKFWGCGSLGPVTMPNGITEIGDHAFRECSSLELDTLPSSLIQIGSFCFLASGISITELPAALLVINARSFGYCSALTEITFNGTPIYVESDAFEGSDNITDIYVPWSSGGVSGAPWGASYATIHYDS